MNNLQIFTNPQFGQLRVIKIKGQTHFFAADVAKLCGYSNPIQVVKNCCKSALKQSIPYSLTAKQKKKVTLIPTKDVYHLIEYSKHSIKRANKPNLNELENWLVGVVISSITKPSHKTNWLTAKLHSLVSRIKAIF